MTAKPTTAAGYPPDQVTRVRATCLYLATKLGDLMPEMVVVGGLVPALLIDQQNLPADVTPYVGTMDLDLGLAFALVGEERYQEVAERLLNAGFAPDRNGEGNPTRQRWRIGDPPVTVDFLIEPEKNAEAQAGRLFSLRKDWAAIIAPGLHLAFRNQRDVALTGRAITGETASHDGERPRPYSCHARTTARRWPLFWPRRRRRFSARCWPTARWRSSRRSGMRGCRRSRFSRTRSGTRWDAVPGVQHPAHGQAH
jgi:hypothetical protein